MSRQAGPCRRISDQNMYTTTTPAWTDEDERQLRELASRKQEVEATQRATVEAIVSTFAYRNVSEQEITTALIERASQIKEALAPYLPSLTQSEVEVLRKKALEAIALGLSEGTFGVPPSSAAGIILDHLADAGLLPASLKRKP